MAGGKPTLDAKTGIAYRSRMEAGKALAHEFNLELRQGYNLTWYDVVRLAESNRFVDIETGNYILQNGSISNRKYITPR